MKEERKRNRQKPGPPYGARGFDAGRLAAGEGVQERMDELEEARQGK